MPDYNQGLVNTARELYGSKDTSAGLGEAASTAFEETYTGIKEADLAEKREKQADAEFKLSQQVETENLMMLEDARKTRTYNKEQRQIKIDKGRKLAMERDVNVVQMNKDKSAKTTKAIGNILKGQPAGKNDVFENRVYTDDEYIKLYDAYGTQLEAYQGNIGVATNVLNDPDFDSDVNGELFDVAESITKNGYTLGKYNSKTNTYDAVVTVTDENGVGRDVVVAGGDFESYFKAAAESSDFSSIFTTLKSAAATDLLAGKKVLSTAIPGLLDEASGRFKNEKYRTSFVNSLPDTPEKIEALKDGVITQDEATSLFKEMVITQSKGQIVDKPPLSAEKQANINYKNAQTAKLKAEAQDILNKKNINAQDTQVIDNLFRKSKAQNNPKLLENVGGIGEIIYGNDPRLEGQDGIDPNGIYAVPRKIDSKGRWNAQEFSFENLQSLDSEQGTYNLLTGGSGKITPFFSGDYLNEDASGIDYTKLPSKSNPIERAKTILSLTNAGYSFDPKKSNETIIEDGGEDDDTKTKKLVVKKIEKEGFVFPDHLDKSKATIKNVIDFNKRALTSDYQKLLEEGIQTAQSEFDKDKKYYGSKGKETIKNKYVLDKRLKEFEKFYQISYEEWVKQGKPAFELTEDHPLYEKLDVEAAINSGIEADDYSFSVDTKGGASIEGVNKDILKSVNEATKSLNLPLVITSGYRNIEKNKSVGGVINSKHLTGNAVDIRTKNLTGDQLTKAVKHFKDQGFKVFPEGDHLHISNTQEIARSISEDYKGTRGDKGYYEEVLKPYLLGDDSSVKAGIGEGIFSSFKSLASVVSNTFFRDDSKEVVKSGGSNKEDKKSIKATQSELTRLGYSPGKVDGLWGKNTQKAYDSYQKDIKEGKGEDLRLDRFASEALYLNQFYYLGTKEEQLDKVAEIKAMDKIPAEYNFKSYVNKVSKMKAGASSRGYKTKIDALLMSQGRNQKFNSWEESEFEPAQKSGSFGGLFNKEEKYYKVSSSVKGFNPNTFLSQNKDFINSDNESKGIKTWTKSDINKNSLYADLGNFSISKGEDGKGAYIAIYDKNDYTGQEFFGVDKGFEIYDRIYYDPKTLKEIK